MLEQVPESVIEKEIEKRNSKEFLKVLSRLGFIVSTVVGENNSYRLSVVNGKTMTVKVTFEGNDQEKLIVTDMSENSNDEFIKNIVDTAKEKGGFASVDVKKN